MLKFQNLIVAGLLFFTSQAFAESVVHRLDRTTVPTANDISFYPQSVVDRPLVLPQKMIEASVLTEYRQVAKKIRGLEIGVKGKYGIMESLEVTLETSILPMSYNDTRILGHDIIVKDNFKFGGILAGANYLLMDEDEKYPSIVGGVKIGFAGTGQRSLTNGSSITVIPTIGAKKTILPRLAVDGGLTLAFGNKKQMGLSLVEIGASYRAYDKFDVVASAGLEGIGLDKTIILSLKPGVIYHWEDNWDVSGGFYLGLVGGEAVGNNFHLGLARRF